MSFEIAHQTRQERLLLSDRDVKDSARCLSCSIFKLCCGWTKFDDSRWCTTVCDSCRALCCRSYNIDEKIAEVGGLDFSQIKWEPFEMPYLPPVVPVLNAKAHGVYSPWYAVNAKKLYYFASRNWSGEKSLKKRFQLPPEAKLMISFSMKDVLLDALIADGLEHTWDRLAEYDADVYLMMDFSMYENYPPFDRLINMKRRFLSLEALQKRGKKVLPSVGWIRWIDWQRHADWCKVNRPEIVAVNMTTVRRNAGSRPWLYELKALHKFRDLCGYPVKFLILGASGPNRLRSICENISGVHFLDSKTYRYAEYKRKVWDKLWDKEQTIGELFEQNLEYLTTVYESVQEGQSGTRASL